MASSKSPWLWTCGIGCGALILSVVVGVIGAGLFFRDTFSGFEQAVNVKEELEARFGDEDDYVAPPGGVIPSNRIEAFLQVRVDTMPRRRQIADFFDMIPDREQAEQINDSSFWDKLTFGISMARGGIGLGSDIGHFLEERNRALLEQEMNLGEYIYIYCTAYYSWLKKSMEDGPGTRNAEVNIDNFSFGRIRDNWIGALERSVEEAAEASEVQALVIEEIQQLREDRNRIPWQDGVPESIAAVLEPFRSDLENTYLAITNPFELVIAERDGGISFSTR